MSKIKYSSHLDGSPKYMYFKKRKHRHERRSMRYFMWKAKQWAIESTIEWNGPSESFNG